MIRDSLWLECGRGCGFILAGEPLRAASPLRPSARLLRTANTIAHGRLGRLGRPAVTRLRWRPAITRPLWRPAITRPLWRPAIARLRLRSSKPFKADSRSNSRQDSDPGPGPPAGAELVRTRAPRFGLFVPGPEQRAPGPSTDPSQAGRRASLRADPEPPMAGARPAAAAPAAREAMCPAAAVAARWRLERERRQEQRRRGGSPAASRTPARREGVRPTKPPAGSAPGRLPGGRAAGSPASSAGEPPGLSNPSPGTGRGQL